MKKIMALAGGTLALVGLLALAGCAPRDRAARLDPGSGQQAPAGSVQNQPAPAGAGDIGSVDSDLNSVDSLLGGVDTDLSAAAKAPDDAD